MRPAGYVEPCQPYDGPGPVRLFQIIGQLSADEKDAMLYRYSAAHPKSFETALRDYWQDRARIARERS